MHPVVIYILASIVGIVVLYLVIHAAVRTALFEHYKIVRRYESTGEWRTDVRNWRQAPSPVDAAACNDDGTA